MEKVTMKVYGFDEASNSLIVAFNSDRSGKTVDEQPQQAYQPTMFEETDPDAVIKKIAQSGVSIAELQDKQDELRKNNSSLEKYKAFVGKELTFSVKELYGPPQEELNNEILPFEPE